MEPLFFEDILKILKFSGGTIHDVKKEIQRLKDIDSGNCKGCLYDPEIKKIWFSKKCPNCKRNLIDLYTKK